MSKENLLPTKDDDIISPFRTRRCISSLRYHQLGCNNMSEMRIIIASIIIVLCCSCNSDEDQIRKIFLQYQSAIEENNYEAHCNNMNSSARKLFSDVTNLTQNADSIQLTMASPFAKFNSILIRQLLDREEMSILDNHKTCELINQYLETNENVLMAELGDLKIEKNKALGLFIINGKVVEQGIYFVKENEEWKVNMTLIYKSLNKRGFGFSMFINMENERANLKIENLTGKTLKTNIWHTTVD